MNSYREWYIKQDHKLSIYQDCIENELGGK